MIIYSVLFRVFRGQSLLPGKLEKIKIIKVSVKLDVFWAVCQGKSEVNSSKEGSSYNHPRPLLG